MVSAPEQLYGFGVLLGGLDVCINTNTITIVDVGSRKNVRISNDFIGGFLVVGEDHSHTPY